MIVRHSHLPWCTSSTRLPRWCASPRAARISEQDWEEMRAEFERRLGAAEKKVGLILLV
jgi:hypothetical protein